MANTRQKKVVLAGITYEQMEQAFGDYALADAQAQGITAEMDKEITKIRERNAEQLAQLQATKDKAFEMMQTYATENRDTLFSPKKSIETVHGVLGFRTGTPKLKTLKGYTWNAVLHLLDKLKPDYVRTKKEVAKDKLLADRDKAEMPALFTELGIMVDQDETFYVEPKKED